MDSIKGLFTHILTAGSMALEGQRNMCFSERDYKEDGSVVTDVDKKLEVFLSEKIAALYPASNILAEETSHIFDADKPFTFVIDPIDGTDVFSQDMAGWSISVGLLDKRLKPIAGFVYAPRLELFFFADIACPATFNGADISMPSKSDLVTPGLNLMVPSRVHQQVDLGRFPGKIRSIGSAALHLCFPLIYHGVFGAVESRGTLIWDIAGSHAINRSLGFDLEYLNNHPINYSAMTDGSPAGDIILAGSPERIKTLRDMLSEIVL